MSKQYNRQAGYKLSDGCPKRLESTLTQAKLNIEQHLESTGDEYKLVRLCVGYVLAARDAEDCDFPSGGNEQDPLFWAAWQQPLIPETTSEIAFEHFFSHGVAQTERGKGEAAAMLVNEDTAVEPFLNQQQQWLQAEIERQISPELTDKQTLAPFFVAHVVKPSEANSMKMLSRVDCSRNCIGNKKVTPPDQFGFCYVSKTRCPPSGNRKRDE